MAQKKYLHTFSAQPCAGAILILSRRHPFFPLGQHTKRCHRGDRQYSELSPTHSQIVQVGRAHKKRALVCLRGILAGTPHTAHCPCRCWSDRRCSPGRRLARCRPGTGLARSLHKCHSLDCARAHESIAGTRLQRLRIRRNRYKRCQEQVRAGPRTAQFDVISVAPVPDAAVQVLRKTKTRRIATRCEDAERGRKPKKNIGTT
jgi:hypothetical protein